MVDAKDHETCQVKKKKPALIFVCVVYLDNHCQAQENSVTIFSRIFQNGRNLPQWKHTASES
jgi:hypothetical protein